jgi:hypothetical protein
MSEPEFGTTLWVYVPVEIGAPQGSAVDLRSSSPQHDDDSKVVTLLSKGGQGASEA